MTNNLQDRFRKIHNSIYLPTSSELGKARHKAFLARATDFINSEVEQAKKDLINQLLVEIQKPELASGIMLDQRDRKWVDLQDLATLLESKLK